MVDYLGIGVQAACRLHEHKRVASVAQILDRAQPGRAAQSARSSRQGRVCPSRSRQGLESTAQGPCLDHCLPSRSTAGSLPGVPIDRIARGRFVAATLEGEVSAR